MYRINQRDNNIEPVEKITFKSAGLKERQHLQEWIAKNPESLGEPLLIIQKEFSEFDETNERLDLLALDKNGNLVVIENKLDDTGKDVTWQALKYASYCSGLNADGVKRIFSDYITKHGKNGQAEGLLEEFLGEDFEEKLKLGSKPRIIMVAGEFRREVTSTVLWLLKFGLKIQCFRVTLDKLGEELLLNFDQIIPPPEAADYMIKVAMKDIEEEASEEELENRYTVRLNYWSQFLKEINKTADYCANISPSKENWLGVALGMSGIGMNFVISRDYARVEIFINTGYMETGGKERNKEIFDYFYSMKEQIENDFGDKLIWERMDDRVTSRVKYQLDGVSVFNHSDWVAMNKFLIDAGNRMRKSFIGHVEKLRVKSKS